ncbi:MAG TPA: hypothetical protein VFU55_03310 [Terracidiphilus sp.]|nr:hypothetical protein [Terracidiphilus sp.]
MEIAPVPGIRALTSTEGRPTLTEMTPPPVVEAAGRMEDDSYAGSGERGDRGMEENLARMLEKEAPGTAAKARLQRSNSGYGEPYHEVDLFV